MVYNERNSEVIGLVIAARLFSVRNFSVDRDYANRVTTAWSSCIENLIVQVSR